MAVTPNKCVSRIHLCIKAIGNREQENIACLSLAFLIAIAEKIRQQIIPDENNREQPDKLE